MTIIVTTTTHFNSEAVYMTRHQAKTHCLHDHHQFCSVDYAIETLATNKIWGFLCHIVPGSPTCPEPMRHLTKSRHMRLSKKSGSMQGCAFLGHEN